MINLKKDEDEIIYAKSDSMRPATNLGSTQGDHTTPFTVLQNQIVNAIQLTSLDDAWVNLFDTYEVYQKLPGWSSTAQWVKTGYSALLNAAFSKKDNFEELAKTANNMLRLRNQMDYTALPNGGHGKGEGMWAGSLHYQERQLQSNKGSEATRKTVICYMWKAFDHERVNNLKNQDKQKNILVQHCMTITDAYPLLCNKVGLNAKDLLSEYEAENWSTWKDAYGK